MTGESYQSYKELLFPIAYNMLGSQVDAEDLVQETLVKWWSLDRKDIENERGYLVRTLVNKCLNFIRDRKKEILEVPENQKDSAVTIPFRVEHDFSLSMSVQTMFGKLGPMERAVFLLKDIFHFSHKEISEFLDISETNCRQILVRARKHLKDQRQRFPVKPEQHLHLYKTFVEVCEGEDINSLLQLLKEDIELEVAQPAATTSIKGRLQAGNFIMAQHQRGFSYELLWLRDLPVLVAFLYFQPVKLIQIQGNGEQISRIDIRNLSSEPEISSRAGLEGILV